MEHIGGSSSGVRTQVGLVGRIRLGQHHRLPEVVFRSGRRVVLPSVGPSTWLNCVCWRWSCSEFQLGPTRTSDKLLSVQAITHFTKLFEAQSNRNRTLQPVSDAVCHSIESLMDHRQNSSPRRPICSRRHSAGGPQPQASQTHRKGCHLMCHLLVVLPTCQTTQQIAHCLQHSFVVAAYSND